MIKLRNRNELGHARHGWLDTRHHFSFANYYDPDRMHWGDLRVWNDDTIAPQTGFPAHSHREMEIITYVRKGAITHKDSLGNTGRTEAGDVQVMSAGTGITHSEYNLEDTETEIFQIWILPNATGIEPGWGTRPFPKGSRAGAFEVLASGYETDNDGLPIHANARVVAATLNQGQRTEYPLEAGHHAYLVPAKGRVRVNGVLAETGDGLAIRDETVLVVEAEADSEVVLVETA